MKLIWNTKFMLANFLGLMLVKTLFLPSSFQFALLLQDPPAFFKEEIIQQTNALRVSLGLSALKEDPTLSIAAAQKLQDMVQNQYFAHFSPSGVSPWHWFQVNRYAYTYAGENLAIGFLDAKSTVEAWANSASHRRNMISSNYQEIGIAAAKSTIKDTEGIIVVQLFGTPSKVAAEKPKTGGLSVGLSQSGAQESSPTPRPSPTPTATATPALARANPEIPGSNTPSLPEGTTSLGENLTKVNAVDPAPAIRALGDALNNTFMLYSFIVALAAIVFLMFGEIRREFLLKAVLHMVIFTLAALIPLLNFSGSALIL